MEGVGLEDWEIPELEAWEEIKVEATEQHFLARECSYVCFVSRSNGRGRKPRRRYRVVELLVYNDRAYMLKTDMTGEIEWIMKDIFPWERIPEYYYNDWYGAFLNALRTMPKIKRSNKKSGKITLHRK